MMAPSALRILAIELFERPVALRLPFRFGVVTLTACPQAFVRVRIRTETGREAEGAAAELLAPKWFDKNLSLSNEDNFDQLRASLALAREAYLSDKTMRPAVKHFAAHYQDQIDVAGARGLNPLIACFGPALLDRAILDALCRALGISFYQAMAANIAGIDATLTPDLEGFDLNGWLGSLQPAQSIAVRHTVGLVDAIATAELQSRVNDGLPETLEEAIEAYGCTYFKLKLSGAAEADISRLRRIAATLGRLPHYLITLDGNEQFPDAAAVVAFWRQMQATPELERLAAATLYIEQPLPRAVTLNTDIMALADAIPVLIDEADNTLDAFAEAIRHGYAGVSSKTCKGLYRSLLNAARCRNLNRSGGARFFMSAEDLTTQAGLAVQQDLALVSLIGLTHVERNGHHYVDGFVGQGAGGAERQAYLAAQPGLYEARGDNVRLAIRVGCLDLSSLSAVGFANRAQPDWATLRPMALGPP
jgi:L-alanine-DL-glutamate epimerase-like enolase superfamily enzyme